MPNWHGRFINLAQVVSDWSKDPSTKCGAVIVRPDWTIASLGFNGFPRGLSDDPDLYLDRETKLSRIIHAEQNAILNSREYLKGYSIYVTDPSCERCAVHIIQAGLDAVYWAYSSIDYITRWRESINNSVSILHEARVEVFYTGMSLSGPSAWMERPRFGEELVL